MEARPHAHTRVMAGLAGLATACVAIVPLVVMPDLLDRFHVIKESVMRAEALIGAFLLVVALTYVARASAREDGRRAEARPTFLLLAVMTAGVAWTGLTALLSTHRALSYDSFVSVLTSALLFLVVWYAAPRIPLAVIDLLVPVVLINAALAAAQEYAVWDPFLHDDPELAQHLKATGLIGNPNVVGSFIALAAVIFAVAAVRVRGIRRWLYVLGAACATASVLVSFTRSALIALGVGLVLLAVGRSRRRAAALLVAVALLAGAGVYFRVPLVVRVLELPKIAREGGLEVASSGRVAPVLAAWEMFRDRPLTGVGPGAYRYWFTEYKSRVREKYGPVVAGTTATSFGDAHNDYVQLLAEAGLPGLLLFLAFLVALWRAVRRGEGDEVRQRLARALVVPLGGAFLVLALAQFPLHLAVTRHLLVTFAGLAIGWSRVTSPESRVLSPESRPPATQHSGLRTQDFILPTIATALCAWTLYAWVWVPQRASIAITELARRTDGAQKTSGDYERTVRARRNVADLAKLREDSPNDVRVPVLIAANQLLIGLNDEAVRSYDDALRVDPRPEIYMQRGDALLQMGRIDEAVESYAAAVRFDPAFLELVEAGELQDRTRARAGIIRRL